MQRGRVCRRRVVSTALRSVSKSNETGSKLIEMHIGIGYTTISVPVLDTRTYICHVGRQPLKVHSLSLAMVLFVP